MRLHRDTAVRGNAELHQLYRGGFIICVVYDSVQHVFDECCELHLYAHIVRVERNQCARRDGSRTSSCWNCAHGDGAIMSCRDKMPHLLRHQWDHAQRDWALALEAPCLFVAVLLTPEFRALLRKPESFGWD